MKKLFSFFLLVVLFASSASPTYAYVSSPPDVDRFYDEIDLLEAKLIKKNLHKISVREKALKEAEEKKKQTNTVRQNIQSNKTSPSNKIQKKSNTSGKKTSRVRSGLFSMDIPRMGISSFFVQRGTGDEQKQLAVGGSLLQGTPIPTGSGNQNSVIGGHRTGYGDPFYYIHRLRSGDPIYIHINGKTLTYRVSSSFIVHESKGYTKVVSPVGANIITLYSCDDGRGNPGPPSTAYRYAVRATLSN